MIFIGVSSGIGDTLWLDALKHAAPTEVTMFLALNPLTAARLGLIGVVGRLLVATRG